MRQFYCRTIWNLSSLQEHQPEFKFYMSGLLPTFLCHLISGLIIHATWTKLWRFQFPSLLSSLSIHNIHFLDQDYNPNLFPPFLSFQVGKIVVDVYSRATKNCPWVGELWVRYMLCLERGHASEKDLAAVRFQIQLSFIDFSFFLFDAYNPLTLNSLLNIDVTIASSPV